MLVISDKCGSLSEPNIDVFLSSLILQISGLNKTE